MKVDLFYITDRIQEIPVIFGHPWKRNMLICGQNWRMASTDSSVNSLHPLMWTSCQSTSFISISINISQHHLYQHQSTSSISTPVNIININQHQSTSSISMTYHKIRSLHKLMWTFLSIYF
jgi:hypothetical protein